jgi:hypothetical protein
MSSYAAMQQQKAMIDQRQADMQNIANIMTNINELSKTIAIETKA